MMECPHHWQHARHCAFVYECSCQHCVLLHEHACCVLVSCSCGLATRMTQVRLHA